METTYAFTEDRPSAGPVTSRLPIAMLGDALSVLETEVSELSKQLFPILANEDSKPTAAFPETKLTGTSPLAETLNGYVSRILYMAGAISNLRYRVEV